MGEAFQCDRCEGFEAGEPWRLAHDGKRGDSKYEKELCKSCYMGWIEYITGVEPSELNEWDAFKVDDDTQAGDGE